MRTFLAIDLPVQVQNALGIIQKKFNHIDLDAKWVDPQNLHMTLKFLGEIDEILCEQVKVPMQEVAREQNKFMISMAEFGFFPDQRRPRVFFIATDHETALCAIADALEEKLKILGFPVEKRFKSHITLARFKGKRNIDTLQNLLSTVQEKVSFEVTGITLFKSVLKSSGPVYEVIAKENFKI